MDKCTVGGFISCISLIICVTLIKLWLWTVIRLQ